MMFVSQPVMDTSWIVFLHYFKSLCVEGGMMGQT